MTDANLPPPVPAPQYTPTPATGPGQGVGGGIGLLLQFFISPVTFFLVPSEIKGMYERDGRSTDLTPLWGLWFLLPLIGAFVWFFKVQGTLNDYWVSKGATPV